MVKPTHLQEIQLNNLRTLVIEIMNDMDTWKNHQLTPLYNIKLGLLRKNATQRHGVTRWQRGVSAKELDITNVDVIELHPVLLEKEWNAYAAFVLHHEFIHALGYRNHDYTFRELEYSWPGINAGDLGPKFTEYLRRKTAKWLWKCHECEYEFPRKKPSNGKYKCRKCQSTLVDVKL